MGDSIDEIIRRFGVVHANGLSSSSAKPQQQPLSQLTRPTGSTCYLSATTTSSTAAHSSGNDNSKTISNDNASESTTTKEQNAQTNAEMRLLLQDKRQVLALENEKKRFELIQLRQEQSLLQQRQQLLKEENENKRLIESTLALDGTRSRRLPSECGACARVALACRDRAREAARGDATD